MIETGNSERNLNSIKMRRVLLIVLSFVFAVGCQKTNDKAKNCDLEKTAWENEKQTTTSDSIAFMDFKVTAPYKILSVVNTYKNQGQTEEEAWISTIENALTNPNAPAEVKEWALKYKELLDKFNLSVNKSEQTKKEFDDCQKEEKK